ESADLGLKESSKRQSSGRSTYHAVSFELPPGPAKIDLTRGSNVYFVSNSDQRIDAVVTPMQARSVRTTFIFTGLVILAALYYISHTLQHWWIWPLRSKLAKRKQQSKSTAA
ncbi:MAG TPA: hypothetical protein VGD99_09260, partial [Anaerolineae bacterium]